jgi:hypothetical protein
MATTTRRAVLGAGGALIASGLAGTSLLGQGQRRGQVRDPILAEIEQQIQDLAPKVRDGSVTAGFQFASAIKTLAAWFEAHPEEQARLRQQARKEIKAKGKAAFANEVGVLVQKNREALPAGRRPAALQISDVEEGLDLLLTREHSAILRGIAANIEQMAPALGGVRLAQAGCNSITYYAPKAVPIFVVIYCFTPGGWIACGTMTFITLIWDLLVFIQCGDQPAP